MSEACAFTMEKILISRYRSTGHPLVNLTDGGEGGSGHTSTRRIPVVCSNGMTFNSAFEAEKWLRSNGYPAAVKSHISNCANGKTMAAYGYAWWRAGDTPKLFTTKVEKLRGGRGVLVYCSNGERFVSAAAAARWVRENSKWTSAMPGNIRAACRGDVLTAYSLQWSYSEFTPMDIPPKAERGAEKTRKPLVTNFGERFVSGMHAQAWLRENGYPKAKQGNISTAVRKGWNSYGRKWYFDE